MIVLLTLVFLLSTQIDHVICSLDRLKGLKFSNTGYIMYSPDMTPFTNKMTVCSWLRDQSSSNWPTVFNYGPVNRVRFEAAGYYNCMVNQCHLDVRSRLKAQVTKGDWFHACLSWSTSSRSLRYYANGKLLGTMTTASRTLSTGYKVVIGNHANMLNSQFSFIGEMRDLNVYSKELTSEEIRRQAEAGMCSLNQDENEDVRVLKWEDLIKLPKTGSVTELPTSQSCLARTTTQLEETQRTFNDIRAQLNSTQEEKDRIAETLQETQKNLNTTLEEMDRIAETLQETQKNLNTTLEEMDRIAETLQETQENLNTTLEEKDRLSDTLQETQENLNITKGNLNSTQLKLEKVSSNLTETMAGLQVALDQIKNCNKTRWDWELFSQSEYFNKTISEEVAEQLSSSWDDIAGY